MALILMFWACSVLILDLKWHFDQLLFTHYSAVFKLKLAVVLLSHSLFNIYRHTYFIINSKTISFEKVKRVLFKSCSFCICASVSSILTGKLVQCQHKYTLYSWNILHGCNSHGFCHFKNVKTCALTSYQATHTFSKYPNSTSFIWLLW